jgi:hypothetical protein
MKGQTSVCPFLWAMCGKAVRCENRTKPPSCAAGRKRRLTIDERLEAIAMHREVLTRVHEDYERKADKRHEQFVRQMTAYSADVKDSIRRLANIAGAHDERLDDHGHRIGDLEDK